MPVCANDMLDELGGGDTAVMTAAMRDDNRSLTDRVEMAAVWLKTGVLPEQYASASQDRSKQLWQAMRDGAVAVHEAVPGKLTCVTARADGALQIGYRLSPVVIACNPGFKFRDGTTGVKYTLAQYRIGHADLDRAVAMLTDSESGWGGSATIKGSPQGHGSQISLGDVVSAVISALI